MGTFDRVDGTSLGATRAADEGGPKRGDAVGQEARQAEDKRETDPRDGSRGRKSVPSRPVSAPLVTFPGPASRLPPIPAEAQRGYPPADGELT